MVELREDKPVRHPISKKRVQNITFRSRAGPGSMAQTRLAQDAIDPDQQEVEVLTRARVKIKKRMKMDLISS